MNWKGCDMAIVFGQVARCRDCGGTGQHPGPMTDDEQKQRDREIRAAKRAGQPRPKLDKPCGTCRGRGIVPPKVADRTAPIQMYEGMD